MSEPVSNDGYNAILKEGILASILGSMAMIARILMSTERVTIGWVIRRLFAACITSILVGYGTKDYIQSESLRLCIVGICGYCAPEIGDFLIQYVKARGSTEIKKIKTKSHGKKKNK